MCLFNSYWKANKQTYFFSDETNHVHTAFLLEKKKKLPAKALKKFYILLQEYCKVKNVFLTDI